MLSSPPLAGIRILALDPAALQARHLLASYPHPVFGELRAVGTPFALDCFAPEYTMAPPLGADNASLLAGLGYSAEEVTQLAAAGALGDPSRQG